MSNSEGDGSRELVRLMTGYVDLKLTGERLNSVAISFGAIRREQAELRDYLKRSSPTLSSIRGGIEFMTALVVSGGKSKSEYGRPPLG
jgi:hypothetical protein